LSFEPADGPGDFFRPFDLSGADPPAELFEVGEQPAFRLLRMALSLSMRWGLRHKT
jgi:hypothetical protein